MQFYKSQNIPSYYNFINRSVFFTLLCSILCFLLQAGSLEAKTTSTKSGGNGSWGDVSNWTNGLPADGDIIEINHVLSFTNVNINIGANTTYNFNAGASGSSIPQSLGMGSSTAILNIYTNVSFAGGINLNGGVINVYTGGTLTVTNQINQAGTLINIEEGANFNVTGNYTNNGGNIAVDGLLAITGEYNGQNINAVVTGSGDITTTGKMKGLNGSTIFGVINPDCGGPCSGRNLCGRIASSTPRTAAYCSTPITLTGAVNNTGGFTPAYQWQISISNTEGGFTDILNATNATLIVAPGTKTYYRVKVKVNNCTSISPVSAVSVSTCSKTWSGVTSSDWHITTNWTPNGVPTLTDDVVIPNVTNKPEINTNSTANAKDIIINASSSLTIFPGGTLNVYGNFSNNGTFNSYPPSLVAFKGTAAQAVSGTPDLYNVTIDNTSGVSLFSTTGVNGALKLTRGVLSTNNYLTIKFDTSGSIAYVPGDLGSIDGNVTGLRYASQKAHYISAPFSGVTSAQVAATTPLYLNSFWKLYTKDFAAQNWIAVTNTITTMPLGMGFSLSLFTAAPIVFTGSYDHSFALTGPEYSNAAANKYFMVGNPYPSTIDWNSVSGWTKTNVGDAIYYWDPANSRVASYVNGLGTNGGKRYIAPMQAFMVTTTGGGGSSSVSINNNARTLVNTSYFRTAQDDIVRVHLISNSDPTCNDETVIRFNEMATGDFDYDLDAHKILNTGAVPSVYTTSKEDTYSINSYTSVESVPYIPLAAKLASDGLYKLKIAGTNPGIDYILIDKLLGTQQSIEKDSAYLFDGLKTDDENRFELQLRVSEITVPTGVQSSNKNSGLGIYSSTKGFVIKTDRYAGTEAEIEIMDMTGNSIKTLSGKNLSIGSTYIPLDFADGAYLIKVRVESNTFAGMIVLVK